MRWSAVGAVVVATVLCTGCGKGTHHEPRLAVTPASALVDTPFRVRVSGLGAAESVTITALGRSRLGKPWRAEFTARADASGQVDLQRRYLLARLRPVRPPAANDYLPWEQNLTVTARAGSTTATTQARRILQPPSVTVTAERPGGAGFYADWIAPRNTRHHTSCCSVALKDGCRAS